MTSQVTQVRKLVEKYQPDAVVFNGCDTKGTCITSDIPFAGSAPRKVMRQRKICPRMSCFRLSCCTPYLVYRVPDLPYRYLQISYLRSHCSSLAECPLSRTDHPQRPPQQRWRPHQPLLRPRRMRHGDLLKRPMVLRAPPLAALPLRPNQYLPPNRRPQLFPRTGPISRSRWPRPARPREGVQRARLVHQELLRPLSLPQKRPSIPTDGYTSRSKRWY